MHARNVALTWSAAVLVMHAVPGDAWAQAADAPRSPPTAAAPSAAKPQRIVLRSAAQAGVAWHGLVGPIEGDPDSASSMPAFGVIGIFVSAARGVAADQAMQDAGRTRQQAADKALDPLRAALDRYDAAALWKETAASLERARISTTIVAAAGATTSGTATATSTAATPEPAPRDAWSVELTPRFMLTDKLDALVVDAVVSLRAPGSIGDPQQAAVRVVSAPGRDASAWKADDAKALKAEAAAMLAHAVELALWHAQRDAAAPDPRQRTHRYLLADEVRAERGWLLREGRAGCARFVVRTLRRGLLSAATTAAPAGCETPYAL